MWGLLSVYINLPAVAKPGPYFWRGEAKTKGMAHVPGMFPRKKSPEMRFQAVWGDILENFNDYKLHQRHDFL